MPIRKHFVKQVKKVKKHTFSMLFPQLCENKNEHQKSGLCKVAHTSQEQNDIKNNSVPKKL